MSAKTDEEILEIIRKQEEQGRITFKTFKGCVSAPLVDFVKQPSDGMLYDLNRDKLTTLTIMSELRWINDYAVAVVINYLKSLEYEEGITRRILQSLYSSWESEFEIDLNFGEWLIYGWELEKKE